MLKCKQSWETFIELLLFSCYKMQHEIRRNHLFISFFFLQNTGISNQNLVFFLLLGNVDEQTTKISLWRVWSG